MSIIKTTVSTAQLLKNREELVCTALILRDSNHDQEILSRTHYIFLDRIREAISAYLDGDEEFLKGSDRLVEPFPVQMPTTVAFPLSKDDIERIRNAVNITEPFSIRKHRGKHGSVFETSLLPKVIIKSHSMPKMGSLKDNIDQGRALIKQKSFRFCHIPPADVVQGKDSEGGYLVMGKAKGVIPSDLCEEMTEQEFEKFSENPHLKEKWHTMFIEAAHFICLYDYWDTSWRNIKPWVNEWYETSWGFESPWLKETEQERTQEGFSFIDNEVITWFAKKRCGLDRLLNMCPVEFIDDLVAIGKEYQVQLNMETSGGLEVENLAKRKQRRSLELSVRAGVRKFHKEKGIKDPLQPIDVSSLTPHSLEKTITDGINHYLRSGSPDNYESLLKKRSWKYQPFVGTAGVDAIAFTETAIQEYELALVNLCKSRVIAGWYRSTVNLDPNDEKYNSYQLFF